MLRFVTILGQYILLYNLTLFTLWSVLAYLLYWKKFEPGEGSVFNAILSGAGGMLISIGIWELFGYIGRFV